MVERNVDRMVFIKLYVAMMTVVLVFSLFTLLWVWVFAP